MIVGYVVGQALTIDTPVIASDSVNYIEARFVFLNRDWDGLAIHAIFDDGDVAYACPLKDGRVAQDNGLNLGTGTWRVHLVGSAMDGDVLVRRITTNPAKIEVVCAGRMDGEPVPPARYTDIEEIEAALTKKIDAPQVAQVGEVLTVEEVDEDGKPIKWKTAPAAAEQVQADWAVNDPTAADYVKNRLGGYYDDPVTVDEEIYSGEINDVRMGIDTDAGVTLVIGQAYKVTIGDAEKTYTAFADSFSGIDCVTIGDGKIAEVLESSEMFGLIYAAIEGEGSEAMVVCPEADVGKTICVTTKAQKREVHKIPVELLDLGSVDESVKQTNAALDALYGDISSINKTLTEGPITFKRGNKTLELGKYDANNGLILRWDNVNGGYTMLSQSGLVAKYSDVEFFMTVFNVSLIEKTHDSGIHFKLEKSDINGGTRFILDNVAGDKTTFYASGKIINSNKLLQLSANDTITEDNATTLRGVKTPEQEYDAANKKYVDQRLPFPATAQVGQIVKVKAVDESGKITETETVDMPTQKTLKWITVHSSDLTETKRELIISTDTDGKSIADYNPIGLSLIVSTPADTTVESNNGAPWIYPSTTKFDNAIRVIGSISGWKTIARDSAFVFNGGSSAMSCTGNVNTSLSTYKLDGYALDGVRIFFNGTNDHLPVGTHVEVAILCEVAE